MVRSRNLAARNTPNGGDQFHIDDALEQVPAGTGIQRLVNPGFLRVHAQHQHDGGGMGGKDALQELLKYDPSIRAIASSGYSNDPVMANPRTYGFCATLPKPYDIPDLMKAVEEARRK